MLTVGAVRGHGCHDQGKVWEMKKIPGKFRVGGGGVEFREFKKKS